jgi:hypothetical protein
LNSVFAQYEELSSPQFAAINLSLRLRLITANFGLDNSSYRAQPHSIIVNYHLVCNSCPFNQNWNIYFRDIGGKIGRYCHILN